jgi:hypothetical protein
MTDARFSFRAPFSTFAACWMHNPARIRESTFSSILPVTQALHTLSPPARSGFASGFGAKSSRPNRQVTDSLLLPENARAPYRPAACTFRGRISGPVAVGRGYPGHNPSWMRQSKRQFADFPISTRETYPAT